MEGIMMMHEENTDDRDVKEKSRGGREIVRAKSESELVKEEEREALRGCCGVCDEGRWCSWW